jgi:succinate dehydrogenase / fumarate reductase cytochrome b subunit
MAQATTTRPLSPHLQIWRWGPAMAFAGLGLLLWWLGAIAGGAESYKTFVHFVWSPEPDSTFEFITSIFGKIALVGLTWAFFQHMSSGVRHFFLDVGAGYELDANARWSIVTMIVAVVLTAAFWAVILLHH